MTSLLEQLPKIVADGKREAERIMERLESTFRVGLQTRELVIPSRDTNWRNLYAEVESRDASLDPHTPHPLTPTPTSLKNRLACGMPVVRS